MPFPKSVCILTAKKLLQFLHELKPLLNDSFTAYFHITAFAIAPQFARRGDREHIHQRNGHTDLDGYSDSTKANGAQHAHCANTSKNDSGRENDGARDDDSYECGGARNRSREAETLTPKPRSESREAEATKSKPPRSRKCEADAAKPKRSKSQSRRLEAEAAKPKPRSGSRETRSRENGSHN